MAYRSESVTNVDRIKILLEADGFVTKYDLADSRNEIRKGVLLYYYPDDYGHIAKDMEYMPEVGDVHVKRVPVDWIVVCYAADFFSMLLCDPGNAFEFPIRDADNSFIMRYVMGQV
jgi:hypothetical protein